MTVTTAARAFDFDADTFAFPNELVWEYHFDARTGRGWTEKRTPHPTYAHHCFPVVRAARQFFRHAQFEPLATPVSEPEYRQRIRALAGGDARTLRLPQPIQIPGFTNLREFSAAHPQWLKEECGGAWQSYVQRGNWRMILPFTRPGQARTACRLAQLASAGALPIIHVATFPKLTINHALLLFAAVEAADAIEFQAYDPNICERPLVLRFDRRSGWFEYPRTHYFPGGRVNAYEVYCGLLF